MAKPTSMIYRPALYYPYIHFRDLEWVKASLLWFREVRRIVPQDFDLQDPPEVMQMRQIIGPDKRPLITEEQASTSSVVDAEKRLLARLEKEAPESLCRFDRKTAQSSGIDQAFQMHEGKLYPLIRFLRQRDLCWAAEGFATRFRDQWLAMHPRLGEAIMSVIAISIAAEKGLDIVTSSGEIHRALVDQDEDAAFRRLIEGFDGKPVPMESDQVRNEVGIAVLLTALDVRKLSVEQICELVREGKDLSRFKVRIDESVKGARFIPDIHEREKLIRETALSIMDEWEQHRKTLPRYAIEALKPLPETKIPQAAMTLITGASTMATLGLGVGIAVAFAVYTGVGAWRVYQEKQKHPLNYLSKVQESLAAIATTA